MNDITDRLSDVLPIIVVLVIAIIMAVSMGKAKKKGNDPFDGGSNDSTADNTGI